MAARTRRPLGLLGQLEVLVAVVATLLLLLIPQPSCHALAPPKGAAADLILSAINGRPVEMELLKADVPEFDAPGVGAVLQSLDQLLGVPPHDAVAMTTALQSLVDAAVQLQAANDTAYPVTRRLVLFAFKQQQLLDELSDDSNSGSGGGSSGSGGGGSGEAGSDSTTATRRSLRQEQEQAQEAQQHLQAQGLVDKALLHFWSLHIDNLRLRKGLVHQLNVPKSGGTAVCDLALAQDGVAPGRGPGCTVQELNDHPSQYEWANGGITDENAQEWLKTQPWLQRPTCEQRPPVLQRRGLSFFSNEMPMFGSESGLQSTVCPLMLNMIMLRNPISRAMAHFLKKKRQVESQGGSLSTLSALGTALPHLADNYYIRSLLGFHAFHLPTAAIAEQHMLAARWVLWQFDMVLITEEGEANDVLLQVGLGWKNSSLSAKLKNINIRFMPERDETSQQHSNGGGSPSAWYASSSSGLGSDAAMDLVYHIAVANSLDIELYKFGARLASLDRLFFRFAAIKGQ